MEKDQGNVRENWGKLRAYVQQWQIADNREVQWAALNARQREEIAADLYDRMIPSWEQKSYPRTCSVVYFRRRTNLHEMVHTYRLCRDVFIYIAAQQTIDYNGPIREVISSYLVLYYSKVAGTFDVANFAQNYKDANSF